jgi:hypothetical protein
LATRESAAPSAAGVELAPEPAGIRARDYPPRLVALITALTLAAFAAGFVLGLIVH